MRSPFDRSQRAAAVLLWGALILNGPLIEPAQADAFILTGSMNTPREHHTATLLPNGRVLVTGGMNNSGAYLSSAEVYDPVTGSWSQAANSWYSSAGSPGWRDQIG